VSEPIVGILLAAGRSTRFGSDKLLHRLPEGSPMAVMAARSLLGACDRLIAVVRPGSEELAGLLDAIGCEILVCTLADAGMGQSLAAGVEASSNAHGWVVALADMPYILPGTHQAVVEQLRSGFSLVATEYRGHRGHPVGFSSAWFDHLVTLVGDKGGKNILDSHVDKLHLCSLEDQGVLRDIDRFNDL